MQIINLLKMMILLMQIELELLIMIVKEKDNICILP